MKEEIEQIKNEILTQNNRSTSYVIFIIVEDKKIYGVCSDWQDGSERKDRDNIDHDWLCKNCQALEENDEELPDTCDDCDVECFVSYQIEKNVPNLYAGFFFTAKAAEEHLENNRHHYNPTAKTYGISAYHNDELKNVLKYLVGEENIEKLK